MSLLCYKEIELCALSDPSFLKSHQRPVVGAIGQQEAGDVPAAAELAMNHIRA